MDFLIHWPPGPVVATVQCQGLNAIFIFIYSFLYYIYYANNLFCNDKIDHL